MSKRKFIKPIAFGIGLAIFLALPFFIPYFCFQWQLSKHPQDPSKLLEIAKNLSANEMVHRLSENGFGWTNVLDGIKSGDSRWLQLANELSTSGSAHPMEELYGALSVVLDRTPEKVLALSKVKPEIVCSFIDEDHGATSSPNFKEIHRHRVEIVSPVNVAALNERKAECLENTKYLLQQ